MLFLRTNGLTADCQSACSYGAAVVRRSPGSDPGGPCMPTAGWRRTRRVPDRRVFVPKVRCYFLWDLGVQNAKTRVVLSGAYRDKRFALTQRREKAGRLAASGLSFLCWLLQRRRRRMHSSPRESRLKLPVVGSGNRPM